MTKDQMTSIMHMHIIMLQSQGSTRNSTQLKLINNVQSIERLTNKPNAMESAHTYPYYSRQVYCSSVET